MFWILSVSLLLSVGISAYLLLKNIRLSTQLSSSFPSPENVATSLESHLVSQSTDALMFVDVSYQIQWVNSVFREWFGLSTDDPSALPHTPVLNPHLFPAFEQVLDGKEASIDVSMVLPNLGQRQLRRTYSPVYDKEQKLIGFTGLIQDRTHTHHVQTALLEAKKEFEHLAQATAHDMRESLRLINSFSYLLSKQLSPSLEKEQQEYLSFIQFEAERMDQFVRDLHQYAQLGLKKGIPEPVSLTHVVEEVSSSLKDQILQTKADIHYSSLPTIQGSFKELTLLMKHLIQNALTFRSPQQSPLIQIDWEAKERFAHISIRDNGIGIAKEYQHQIFSMFRRLHSRTAYPGSGIGLACCKKIVELHGGDIWVESNPHQGATFSFSLPIHISASHTHAEKIPV